MNSKNYFSKTVYGKENLEQRCMNWVMENFSVIKFCIAKIFFSIRKGYEEKSI